MMRIRLSFLPPVLSGLFLALAVSAGALNPQPEVEQGDGYKTWMASKDARLWRLEELMHDLRKKDESWRNMVAESVGVRKVTDLDKTLDALGVPEVRIGRSLHFPRIEEPIRIETQRLGFEWRKHAVVSFPAQGRHSWFVVVMFQDSNEIHYWRPYQIFMFDTDPAKGLNFDWPDILDDAIPMMAVRHLEQNATYGNMQVMSLFKFDERRLRLTWQETDDHWRAGKFTGTPTWTKQNLKFGNQRIERTLTQSQHLYTEGEEIERYIGEEPYRVLKGKEIFSWNPMGFSFYHAEDELLKLKSNSLPEIRRQAARRLGLILKTSHAILEQAMLSDKDAMVRIQSALAIAAIGDPEALKSVEKALTNWDEPDNVVQALRQAQSQLEAVRSGEAKKIVRQEPKKRSSATALTLPLTEADGPKMLDERR